MPVRFEIEGLEDLRQALLKLPDDLASRAQFRIAVAVYRATSRISGLYPIGPRRGRGPKGVRLRAGLSGTTTRDGVAVVGLVKDTARHAWLYENGSAVRRTDYPGKIGTVNRGAMPPAHVFIPAMSQERRDLYEDLKAIVQEAGLEVSGDA